MKNIYKKIWEAIKPDPYEAIARNMRFEGYTDFEIAMEIREMKKQDEPHKVLDK